MKYARWLAAALVGLTPALAAQPTVMQSEVGTAQAVDQTTVTDEVAIGADKTKRMTVDVSVKGTGPFRFLVDTGSERTIISRQLASRLQLETGRNTTLHSVIGVNAVKTVNIPELRVSNKKLSVANAPALEATNIGADGMLGIDSLRSQMVKFDFKAGVMAITPARTAVIPYDKDTIVVRARSRKGRLIFTDAHVGSQPVTVIIDTGSQVSIGNLALEQAMVKRRVWLAPEPLTIQSVTGETMVANVTVLDELELGPGVGLHKLPVAFANAHIFRKLGLEKRPAILLGMNAMRAFDQISIDFASRKVRFLLPETGMLSDRQLAEAKLR